MKASFQAGGGGGGSKYSDYCLSAVEPTNTVCSLLVSQFRPDNRSGWLGVKHQITHLLLIKQSSQWKTLTGR